MLVHEASICYTQHKFNFLQTGTDASVVWQAALKEPGEYVSAYLNLQGGADVIIG